MGLMKKIKQSKDIRSEGCWEAVATLDRMLSYVFLSMVLEM